MVRDADEQPKPTTWGRRPYADKEARELLNDVSRRIARDPPDHVDDPGDLALSDVLKATYDPDTKADTLADLMGHGLNFEEAVCWYWFRYAQFSLMNIHFAIQGIQKGGDPSHRRNSIRNIQRILESAAFKLPNASVSDVPDLDDVIDADASGNDDADANAPTPDR